MGHPTMQENDTAKLTPTLRIIVLRNVEVLILIKTYIIMKKFKIYRDNQHMDEFFLKKGFVK